MTLYTYRKFCTLAHQLQLESVSMQRCVQDRRVPTRSRPAGPLAWTPTQGGCCLVARAAAAAKRAAAVTCWRRLHCAASPVRTDARSGLPACASPPSSPQMLLLTRRYNTDLRLPATSISMSCQNNKKLSLPIASVPKHISNAPFQELIFIIHYH